MSITPPLSFTVKDVLPRPIADVYEAIADPAQLCRYFTLTASGPMEPGAELTWTWSNGEAETVRVAEAIPHARLAFEWRTWKTRTPTRIGIDLASSQPGLTEIAITESGWAADAAGLESSYAHCAGWQHFLTCLRAWLLHGIDLRTRAAEPDTRPTLHTDRLFLRPLRPEDAEEVMFVCDDPEVAANTMTIPHPYTRRDADRWLAAQQPAAQRNSLTFAICLKESGRMVGTVGLMIQPDHGRAELGYVIAKPDRNKGYATEAAREVVRFGFEGLGLNRIYAAHYVRNPLSGRVLTRIGMKAEGTARRHIKKWGAYEDTVIFAILHDDPTAPQHPEKQNP